MAFFVSSHFINRLKTIRVWTVSYTHLDVYKRQGDHPYEFTYMFKLAIDLPAKVTEVVLPDNKDIVKRAGTKAGNKGYDCALSAIEMANLFRQM